MSRRVDLQGLLPLGDPLEAREGARVVWVSEERPAWVGATGTIEVWRNYCPVVRMDSPVRNPVRNGKPMSTLDGYFYYRWARLPGALEDTA